MRFSLQVQKQVRPVRQRLLCWLVLARRWKKSLAFVQVTIRSRIPPLRHRFPSWVLGDVRTWRGTLEGGITNTDVKSGGKRL